MHRTTRTFIKQVINVRVSASIRIRIRDFRWQRCAGCRISPAPATTRGANARPARTLKGGARRSRMKTKVFGGGRVLRGMTSMNVGDRNADFVLKFLRTESIPVVGQDLREPFPRKVAFMP